MIASSLATEACWVEGPGPALADLAVEASARIVRRGAGGGDEKSASGGIFSRSSISAIAAARARLAADCRFRDGGGGVLGMISGEGRRAMRTDSSCASAMAISSSYEVGGLRIKAPRACRGGEGDDARIVARGGGMYD